MPQKHPEPQIFIFLCPVDEKQMIRDHIAKEEGLSQQEVKRSYSDSILNALLMADPGTYTAWADEAYLKLCATSCD